MAHKSYGIYYNGQMALGVEVTGSGPNCTCNTIKIANDIEKSGSDQLEEITKKLTGSKPLALAVGGTMYINHDHRSEFLDIQQAVQTLKFDIEDHLAVDADNIAISFQEKPTQTSTIDLIVYTAARNILSDTFVAMENNGCDPIAAMPSAAAWQIYLANAQLTSESAIYVGRSAGTLQIMILNEDGKPVTCRKFPVNNDNAFYEILKLELNRCLMTALPGMNIQKIYFHSEGISESIISDIASDMDLTLKSIPEESFAKAVAIGAALSVKKGVPSCNFRSDDMEPESVRKGRFTAKIAMSALASLIFICWTVFNVIHTIKYKEIEKTAQDNIVAVAEKCGVSTRSYVRIPSDMQRKLREIKQIAENRGSLNSNSAANTFSLTISALSTLNPEFDLDIKSMTFKPNEVKPFSGTVADLEALETLRAALRTPESKLAIAQETSKQDGNRLTFEMPLVGADK